jgi:hypothetical protein
VNLRSAASILMFVLTLLPATAWADRHRAEAFAAFIPPASKLSGSKLEVLQGSSTLPLFPDKWAHAGLSMVLAGSWYSEAKDRFNLWTVFFGPRWTTPVARIKTQKLLFLGQVLGGVSGKTESTPAGLKVTKDGLGASFSVGLEFPACTDLAFRGQRDWVVYQAPDGGKWGRGWTVGIVFRWGEPKDTNHSHTCKS